MRRRWVALALALSATWGSAALAGDLADEADLQFQLGAEAYSHTDFRGALEHFLASNRLVPNRNVTFNIARCHEQLRDWPAAWRYYAEARAGETDEAQRRRVEEALDRVRPNVIVLDVDSEPPGASVYVGRKDLGERGVTPLSLGLAPGDYTLLVEIDGYEPVSQGLAGAKAGDRRAVHLALRPILGTLVVTGDERGARVRIGSRSAPPRCTVPCRLQLRPGHVNLWIESPGRRTQALEVDIVGRQTVTLRPQLTALTGSLLVQTDEPGALVSVDGNDHGFTPSILTLPVGTHRVRVRRAGYFTIERRVTVRHEHAEKLDLVLTEATQVQVASREEQLVEDAPGSVSIVDSHQLRVMAYPTLGEALRGVRGMYLTDDRSYVSLGVRGLSTLRSYGNRSLVLIDGQSTNDDWIGSSYVGFDLRTDLADVERVEVVRGPGSVLYGTNAFSSVVNLVMRPAGSRPRFETGVSVVDSGVGRVRVRAEAPIGRAGGVWTSVSAAHSSGRDFQFPEYLGDPAAPTGEARSADALATGTLSGGARYRWLTVSWHGHNHDKRLPTGEYESLLGDGRSHQRDTRAFLELRAEPDLGGGVRSLTRVHFNHYRFLGEYARTDADGGVEQDTYRGTWFGLEQRFRYEPSESWRFTIGGEGQRHTGVRQTVTYNTGSVLDDSHPYTVAAAYALAEGDVTRRARVSVGARLDSYSTFGSSLNPRASLILRPWDSGNLEFMFGRAFRAPSVYELYYNDGGETQVASPDLQPEATYSGEIELSQRLSPTVAGTLATYASSATGLIVGRGDGTPADPLHYQNSGAPLVTFGAEVELRRSLRQGWTAAASYGLSRSLFVQSGSPSDVLGLHRAGELREVANAPVHSAALFGSVPLVVRGWFASTRLTWLGQRWDRFESQADEPQRRTDDALLWDVVFSGHESRFDLGWAVGVYNAFDTRWFTPVSDEFRQRRMLQTGRTFLASAELAF